MTGTSGEFQNPFRPGAGHAPPYLAGRQDEKSEFERLLTQDVVLENMILTGLRGVGKTVLLDTFKPIAQRAHWLWVGADLSESTSVSEEAMAIRLITDLATITSGIVVSESARQTAGFLPAQAATTRTLGYDLLTQVFSETPGLVADKLKAVLTLAWQAITSIPTLTVRGVVFAYDEAQNLADQAAKEQYPLSLLLDVFQSLQRQGMRFLLVLTGLPTLFPKLVDARTFAERMFRVVFLNKLPAKHSREAVEKPISDAACPFRLSPDSVNTIVEMSGGYPYFIQFLGREVYDSFLANLKSTGVVGSVPTEAISRKLDTDFFAGRWARVTDRQRDLLWVIANLKNCDEEFTVQEIVECSQAEVEKAFSSSHVNQMLQTLSNQGLVYKNRHGKYSFAVPMFGQFVLRQMRES